METTTPTRTPWSTASYGDAPDTSPMELSTLGEHLHACTRSHGRWFTLQCVVERVSRFVAARTVTTLAAAALLIGLATLWL